MPDDRQFVTSLERGLKILQVFSRSSGGLSNGDLAEQTGLARSTISRLVHTLRALGYLSLDPVSRRYFLKPKVLTLGYSVLSETTLLQRTRPALQRLAEVTGETAALAVRDGLHATFLDCARGRNMLAVQMEVGARLPLASSASGLALLKASPEAERRRTVSRLRANMTQQGVDHGPFKERLDSAMSSDIIVVRDAWHKGIGGLAAAVRFGETLGAITIAVSTAVVSETAMRDDIGQYLLDTIRDFQLELVQ